MHERFQMPGKGRASKGRRHQTGRDRPLAAHAEHHEEPQRGNVPPLGRKIRQPGKERIHQNRCNRPGASTITIRQRACYQPAHRAAQQKDRVQRIAHALQLGCARIEHIGQYAILCENKDLAFVLIKNPTGRRNRQHQPLIPRNTRVPRSRVRQVRCRRVRHAFAGSAGVKAIRSFGSLCPDVRNALPCPPRARIGQRRQHLARVPRTCDAHASSRNCRPAPRRPYATASRTPVRRPTRSLYLPLRDRAASRRQIELPSTDRCDRLSSPETRQSID